MTSLFRFANGPAADTGTPPVAQEYNFGAGENAGKTPVATLFQISGATSTNAVGTTSRYGLGITDGSTHRVVGWLAENGNPSSSADAESIFDTTTVMHLPTAAAETLAGEARWTDFHAGGVEVEWDDLLESLLVNTIQFFDCDADVVEFAGNATADASSTLSGDYDLLISVSHFAAYSADGAASDMKICFGFAARDSTHGITQGCHTKFVNDRNAFFTSHAAVLRDDSFVASINQTSDSARLEVTSWSNSAVTITTRAASVSISTAILALKTRRRLWIGIPSLTTNATGVQSIATPGFRVPSYLCLATRLVTKNTTNRASLGDGWTHGGWSGEEQFFCGGFEGDNTPDAVTRCYADFLIAAPLLSQTGPTYSWKAQHYSTDAAGFSIEIIDASISNEIALFLAVGPLDIVASDTEQISDQAIIAGAAEPQADTETLVDQAVLTGLAPPQSDTETIVDQHAINVSEALSDSETIVDQTVLTGSAPAQSDTETITDQTVLSATGNLAFDDTEDLLDQHAFALDIAHSDTEEISENVILLAIAADALLIVVSDIVTVDDQFVFSGTGSLVFSDTVEIEDRGNLAGDALIVVSDSETITENEQHYLGNVIVVSDTETITDDLSTPITATQTKGTQRGTSFQGGAEQGQALEGGAERGTVL